MIVVPNKRNSRLSQNCTRVPLFGGTPSEPAITAPTSLTATATSSTTADLDWSWSGDEANIDGFSIERQLSTGDTWSEITTVGAAARSYEDTGLTADTEYDWRVRAFVTGPPEEFSAYSNVASVDTGAMTLTYDTTLSAGTTIEVPLGTFGGGAVDVTVDWGDETQDSYTTTGNKSHTYATEGTYTVSITGSLDAFGDFQIPENIEKLIGCGSFGNLGLVDLTAAFSEAVNITNVPDAIPSTVTTLTQTCRLCELLNDASVAEWNTSSVESFNGTFLGNTNLDQDLSSWNVSSLMNAPQFLENVKLSTANYNALLIGWEGQRPNIQSDVVFDGGNSTYTAGGAAATARSNLINDFGWTITDGGSV